MGGFFGGRGFTMATFDAETLIIHSEVALRAVLEGYELLRSSSTRVKFHFNKFQNYEDRCRLLPEMSKINENSTVD